MKIFKYIMVLTTLSILISCGSSSNGSSGSKLEIPPKNKIYFGAFPDFGGSEDIVSKKRVADFENIAGKKIAWAYFSNNWYRGIIYPKKAIHAIRDAGSIPFVRLMPRSDDIQGRRETYFSLQNIINGKFDNEIKEWAKDAKKDNIPLLVDFAVEPNGDWFQWSGIFNGGAKRDAYGDPNYPDGPERYRDAYRHIIDIFKEEGVNNITWFFHFNYASYPDKDWNKPKYYYPGDDYIDWIGFSLYGAQEISEEWEGLDFSTQLKEYASDMNEVSSSKPIALLEFGVTDNHPEGSKSQWLNDAFSTILSNKYIKFSAISPWHENWENDDGTYTTLRLDSSEETLKTFRKWIKNEIFISKLNFK